jgi:N-acetylglucosamine-6-phosphate deacetylase
MSSPGVISKVPISPVKTARAAPESAHPPGHWQEFCDLQKASGNRIRLVTVAPEVPHAIEFIRRAVETGVRISIGHTAATGEQIAAAVTAGATLSTHLGNGAHPIIRRHPNYIWEQLGDARLSASIITDGQHLPDSVIRSIVRAKSVPQTISPATLRAGRAALPGSTKLGKVEVPDDGRIVVAYQRDILKFQAATDACVARRPLRSKATLREAIDMTCGTRLGFSVFQIRPAPGHRRICFCFGLIRRRPVSAFWQP